MTLLFKTELTEAPSTFEKTGPWLLLVVALSLLLGNALTPLIDLDEGAFTAATLEMAQSGDYLLTYLNGQPRYDKPILIYWLQLASASSLGFNEFALRLPSILMGFLWVAFAYVFSVQLFDRRTALWVALVTATAAGPNFIWRLAIADALLDACLAGALFAQYAWLRLDRPVLRWLGWLAMALGFLAKGPIALIVPLTALFLHCLSRGEWRRFLAYVFDLRAIVLFAVIALPWYAAVTWIKGPEFIEAFFLKHNVGRFSGGMGRHHAYGLFYYIPILLLITLPFTGLLPGIVHRLREHWSDDFSRYALISFGIVFALFSASVNKLPHYLLYGTAPLFVLLGRQLATARSRWLLLPSFLVAVLLLLLPNLLDAMLLRANDYYRMMFSETGTWFGLSYRLPVLTVTAIMAYLLIENRFAIADKLVAVGVMMSVLMSLVILPAIGGLLQTPVKQAGLLARTIDAPLVMYGINTPSLSVYALEPVLRRPPLAGDLVLVPTDKASKLSPHRIEGIFRNLMLVRINTP
jgi:4-amino-4-deoxy-L-arabinose transferase-like glycosyltransferase